MSSFQLGRLQRVRTSGEIWDIEFHSGLNLLIGEENTSKTTTLRIIDFCLGDDQNARNRFGESIDEEYQEFRLSLRINGSDHLLIHRLHAAGQLRSVDVDGQPMDTPHFNAWIGRVFGWPNIRVPRGLNVTAATQEDPLTFRTLLRHIYRRADSWTSFASNEWEHSRRAVVSFFLGVAEELYGQNRVEDARLTETIAELEQQRRDLRSTLDEVIRRTSDGFRATGTTNMDSISKLVAELDEEILQTRVEREHLAHDVRAVPDYDERQDQHLAALDVSIRSITLELADLSQVLTEQRRLVATLEADVGRTKRAHQSLSILGSVAVTACPACFQSIKPPSDEDERNTCYVCHQPIRDADRLRRLDLEEKAVTQESKELSDVVRELQQREQTLRQEHDRLAHQRSELLATINHDRRAFIAPHLQEFERLQHHLGQIEQRRETLIRLGQLQDLVQSLEAKRIAVEARLVQLQAAAERSVDRGVIVEQTSKLAHLMNEFIGQLPLKEGIGGPVLIDPNGFAFYVGRETWENALGNERRVPFLLAYHYALLRMAVDGGSAYPGVVLLDNPFQQDVDPAVVTRGLEVMASCCVDHPQLQVIVATRRELKTMEDVTRIRFEHVFNPELKSL